MAKHKTQALSWLQSLIVMCNWWQEGDDFNTSSSSHLNKFKIGLFSLINSNALEKTNNCKIPVEKSDINIPPRTEYTAF